MKHVLDTNIVNRLAKGRMKRSELPAGEYVVTHVQRDELAATGDRALRARLLAQFTEVVDAVQPTESAIVGVSKVGGCKCGSADEYRAVLDGLNALKMKPNNVEDALIAEVAILNGYVLVTADSDLATVARARGCKVVAFRGLTKGST